MQNSRRQTSQRAMRPKASDYDVAPFTSPEESYDDGRRDQYRASQQPNGNKLDDCQTDYTKRQTLAPATTSYPPWRYDTVIPPPRDSGQSRARPFAQQADYDKSIASQWQASRDLEAPNSRYNDLFKGKCPPSRGNPQLMEANVQYVNPAANGNDKLQSFLRHVPLSLPTLSNTLTRAISSVCKDQSQPVYFQNGRSAEDLKFYPGVPSAATELDTAQMNGLQEEVDPGLSEDDLDALDYPDIACRIENFLPIARRLQALESTMELAEAQDRKNPIIPSRYFRSSDGTDFMTPIMETECSQAIKDDPMFVEIDADAPVVPFWQLLLHHQKLKIENNGWNNFNIEEQASQSDDEDQMSSAMSESEQGSPSPPIAQALDAHRTSPGQEKRSTAVETSATRFPSPANEASDLESRLQAEPQKVQIETVSTFRSPEWSTSESRIPTPTTLVDRAQKQRLAPRELFPFPKSAIHHQSSPDSRMKDQKNEAQLSPFSTIGSLGRVHPQFPTTNRPHRQPPHTPQPDKLQAIQSSTTPYPRPVNLKLEEDDSPGMAIVQLPKLERVRKAKTVRFANDEQQVVDQGHDDPIVKAEFHDDSRDFHTTNMPRAINPTTSNLTPKARAKQSRQEQSECASTGDSDNASPEPAPVPVPELTTTRASIRSLRPNPKPSRKRQCADADVGPLSRGVSSHVGANCQRKRRRGTRRDQEIA